MTKFKLTMRYTLVLSVVVLVAGCFSVPKEMQVRSGASPAYQDDNVRFRTTYYFRVLSLCGNSAENGNSNTLETDSLYRFRMTGKAGALANEIHFESGFLHKDTIDPFGTVVSYDSEQKRFHVSSHESIQRASKRSLLMDEVEEYLVLLKDPDVDDDKRKVINTIINNHLKKVQHLDPILNPNYNPNQFDKINKTKEYVALLENPKISEDHKTTIKSIINQFLKETDSNLSNEKQIDKISKTKEYIALLENPNISENDKKSIKSIINHYLNQTDSRLSNVGSNACTDNNQYAFQVLGPQGIRTYDQDQRLILSMSTSAKPLVSTLKELATRMMPRPTNNTEALLQITEERLILSRAERELFRLEDEVSRIDSLDGSSKGPAYLADNILNEFKKSVEGKDISQPAAAVQEKQE